MWIFWSDVNILIKQAYLFRWRQHKHRPSLSPIWKKKHMITIWAVDCQGLSYLIRGGYINAVFGKTLVGEFSMAHRYVWSLQHGTGVSVHVQIHTCIICNMYIYNMYIYIHAFVSTSTSCHTCNTCFCPGTCVEYFQSHYLDKQVTMIDSGNVWTYTYTVYKPLFRSEDEQKQKCVRQNITCITLSYVQCQRQCHVDVEL